MSPASNTATPLHDAPDDPLVGAVLAGSYALGEVMARGGMGVLYSAEHTRLGTPLVVKVLRKRYALYYMLTFMSGARRQLFMAFGGFLLVKKFGKESMYK